MLIVGLRWRCSWLSAKQAPEVGGGTYAGTHVRHGAVFLAAEARQDRLDDRRVIEHRRCHLTLRNERRDDDCRYARPEPVKGRVFAVVLCSRRRDVIVEAAMLVVGDEQQRLRPRGTTHNRVKSL